MKEWQFNILFFVGVGAAIFLLIGPEFGVNINQNPTALAGVGSILTYILTQRRAFTNKSERTNRRRTRKNEERRNSQDDHEELGDDE